MGFFRDLQRLFAFLRTHADSVDGARRTVLVATAASALSGLCAAGLLVVVNYTLQAEAPGSGAVLAFVGLCIVLPISRSLAGWLLSRLAQQSTYRLRLDMSRRALEAPLRRIEEIGTPRLLAALTSDVPAVAGALAAVPIVCMHLAVVVGSLAYLAWLSPTAFVAVAAFILLGLVTYQRPNAFARRLFAASREAWDGVFGSLEDLTSGLKELKQHRARRDAFLDDRLAGRLDALRKLTVRGDTVYAVVNSWGQVLFFVLIGLVVFGAPTWGGLERDVLTGYILVILYMMTPLEVLLGLLPDISQAAIAVGKLDAIGEALDRSQQPLLTDAGGDGAPPVMPRPWDRIELRGVRHAYGAEAPFSLGPIDLTLRPGELVIIEGGNGSGKTTLARVLLGLYAPIDGTVSVDGVVVTDATRDDYRQLFTAVFADAHVFDTFLGLGDPAQVDPAARTHAAALEIDRAIEIQDGAVSTVDLSTGQRKRLALLTALLEDRPVFVLDEWAADQDPVFKRAFYLDLLPQLVARGKTVILISHDDRYFGVADRVVKMEDGKVVDEYAPADLAPSLDPVSL